MNGKDVFDKYLNHQTIGIDCGEYSKLYSIYIVNKGKTIKCEEKVDVFLEVMKILTLDRNKRYIHKLSFNDEAKKRLDTKEKNLLEMMLDIGNEKSRKIQLYEMGRKLKEQLSPHSRSMRSDRL